MGTGILEHLGYPLSKCPFSPSAHLPLRPFVKISGKWAQGHLEYPLGAFGVPFSPKCPFAPSPHLPQCPICKHLGEMSTWGTPLPQMYIYPKCPFTPVPICKHLGKKGIRHLGYPFRALGVPVPLSPNVHLPQVPICEHFGVMGPGHLGYPFPPNVHFFQVPICPTAHLQTFEGKWAQEY